jgi:PAS domain S-box-containing protein
MPGMMMKGDISSLPAGVLQRLFHDSPEGLLVVSNDGVVLEANDAFLRLLKASRSEVLGATTDQLGLWDEPLAGIITTERIPGEDGEVLLIREVAANPQSAILRELRAVEVRFQTLVEQIPAITYTEVDDPTSPTGTRTKYMSPQASLILGYAPEELLDDELWNTITHPEDFPDVMAEEARVDRNGEPFLMEYRVIAKDGSIRWFRDESVLLQDPHTGQKMWQGVMLDITEARASAAELQEAQLRYQSLVETLPAVVFVDEVDGASTNIYTSPQTEAILGYTVQDWAEDPDLWRKILHPEDRDAVLATFDPPTGALKMWDTEYRLVAKDGRPVWVREVARMIDGADGKAYAQGFLLDITGQKIAEKSLKEALSREHLAVEQLRALDGLKNTVLHALSHDLKGPITAILGSASTLVNPDLRLGEEERRDFLRGITDRAIRMDRLLTDILDVERLDRGLVEPDRTPTDLGRLARSVAEHCDALTGRAYTVVGEGVTVSVDAAKVERILDNLLANAARYTPEGAPVEVSVRVVDGGAEISVEDRGPGVPDDVKAVVFEAFRQGPEGMSHSTGMGIGLSLVSRFAELHGGRAWVEDRPGGGASFKVYLPG